MDILKLWSSISLWSVIFTSHRIGEINKWLLICILSHMHLGHFLFLFNFLRNIWSNHLPILKLGCMFLLLLYWNGPFIPWMFSLLVYIIVKCCLLFCKLPFILFGVSFDVWKLFSFTLISLSSKYLFSFIYLCLTVILASYPHSNFQH